MQEIALKMHEFGELQSQTDLVGSQNTHLCKLHFIKQLNEGVRSQVAYMMDPVWLEMDQKWNINYKSTRVDK